MRLTALFLVTSLTHAGFAYAQDSRAEELQQKREEKQQSAAPYRQNVFEKFLKAGERGGVPLITRDGLYAKLGSLTTGSGFAYGVGYRNHRFLRRDSFVDLWGGASFIGYWAAEARVRAPNLANGRLLAEGYVRRHEYPQEDYFGLGASSRRGAHSDFALRSTIFGGRAAVRPARIVAIGGGVEYLQPRVGDGTDDSLPSISDEFDESTAPGLTQQPDFLRTSAFVEVDWRRPLNARRGGWYRAEFSRYDDQDLGAFTFNRFDVDLRQFVGFLSERRVLAGRVFATTSDVAAGQEVPFYLMPTLGGKDTLRGYREYRFRGPHALLFQGEYRFEIWSGLDGALFTDAGKVGLQRSDLNLKDLESNYGIGFRFNTDTGTILRVDAAFGSNDGKHLWIVFGGTF